MPKKLVNMPLVRDPTICGLRFDPKHWDTVILHLNPTPSSTPGMDEHFINTPGYYDMVDQPVTFGEHLLNMPHTVLMYTRLMVKLADLSVFRSSVEILELICLRKGLSTGITQKCVSFMG